MDLVPDKKEWEIVASQMDIASYLSYSTVKNGINFLIIDPWLPTQHIWWLDFRNFDEQKILLRLLLSDEL